jgi:MoaA/NifB/PqqE/SkfB family radical SAM enzyme
MCNIWQIPNPPSLPPAIFENLGPHLKYINLSGGEPFLYPHLLEIVRKIKNISPNAQIIISSNGLATGLILSAMEKILAIDPKIGVRISIDGDREMHEQVRGVPGIYSRAFDTVAGLKKLGVENIGISFTIMDFNAEKIIPVYEFSKANNLQFALALVQNSDIYFNKQDNAVSRLGIVDQGLNHIVREELASWNPKKWLRAFYDYGLKYYADKQERLLPSGAGFDSLFIDANGDIFPSNLINLKMGNITQGELDEIWNSPGAQAVRQEIVDKKISESWIICTIRGEMRKHPLKVLSWVGWNKARVILGAKSF